MKNLGLAGRPSSSTTAALALTPAGGMLSVPPWLHFPPGSSPMILGVTWLGPVLTSAGDLVGICQPSSGCARGRRVPWDIA